MKKILALVMALALIITCFAGCNKAEETTEEVEKPDIKIAGLQGPTGMGMAYLFDDYDIEVYSSPDEVTGKLVSGEIEIAAVPTNVAATLYNKTNGKVKLLALNTGCVLYILEKGDTIKSISDLEGKTIYVSGQGSTPEYVLEYILEKNGVEANLDFTYSTHADLVTFAATGKADVVLLPEPAVTSLLAQSEDWQVALSLEDLWDEDSSIAMGCLAVNTEFADANPDAIATFLRDYAESIIAVSDTENIDAIAEKIAEVGIVAKAGVAKAALPRCNIFYASGDTMKESIEPFYELMYNANPDSVGGKLPDDDFYYGTLEKN